MMGTAWDRFWFAPRSIAPLVLVRIAYGVLAIAWTLSLLPDLRAFFTSDGLFPSAPRQPGLAWGLFAVADAPWVVTATWVILLGAAVAVLVGWHTRAAGVLVFLLVTSF